ncbi:hypothetical protein W97_04273 [Coniosporium apollinis CBS 100218]|uniref:Large ribosomal subunit protein bL34m n=1 Tax=Coniosporium apollinis (strain CBS 100218) TaxID=1168221 RepID=R7YT74_CONA1|nr:uncharacterized protein W97_04273 [Coniosporium apollinis CBS 100218]EON65038.1 hypothetical protein W97_04273 [Coniosporium apollinis CBS 100218]
MQCLRCLRSFARLSPQTPTALLRAAPKLQVSPARQTRNLSLLSPRRPILSNQPALAPSPSPSPATSALQPSPVSSSSGLLDILPRISTHPALASQQVRCGPRDTYNPSHLVRKRRHGFLARVRTRTGRNILKRRRAKGRKSLTH